eukprot:Pgem_evm1s2922
MQGSVDITGMLLVASLFYMIAASVILDQENGADNNREPSAETIYALCCGVISSFCMILCVVFELFKDAFPPKFHLVNSFFWFVFWCAGTGVGTFRHPFKGSGHANGYFSAWFALIISAYYFAASVSNAGFGALDKAKGRTFATFGVAIVGSCFYLTQAATDCGERDCSANLIDYAVAVGAIGLFFNLLLLALCILTKDIFMKIGVFIAGLNLIWWLVGLGVTTFIDPYTQMGNGYISAWFATIGTAGVFALVLPSGGKLGSKSEVVIGKA